MRGTLVSLRVLRDGWTASRLFESIRLGWNPFSPFVHCLVFSSHSSVFTHQWVCKALRKHVGLQGFIMKLRIKHTRNNPDVPPREFLCSYRIVNSGTCKSVHDKTTLGGGTWHFVEDDGRLFKLISNEFAAWLVSPWFSYFNFSSVCPALVWLSRVFVSIRA